MSTNVICSVDYFFPFFLDEVHHMNICKDLIFIIIIETESINQPDIKLSKLDILKYIDYIFFLFNDAYF